MNCERSHYVHWRDVDSCASNLNSQEMCTADISNSQCEVCMNNNCEKCRLIGCDVCFPNACKHPLFPLSILLQAIERDLWIFFFCVVSSWVVVVVVLECFVLRQYIKPELVFSYSTHLPLNSFCSCCCF